MRKFLVSVVFLVIAAILIAGCTTAPQPAPQPVQTPAPLPPTVIVTTPAQPAVPPQLAQYWVLTQMAIQDGTALTYPTNQITLYILTDGTLNGNSGCNNYNGPFTLSGVTTPKGQGISVGPLVSTKKYCAEYSNQESMYQNILGKAMAYNVNGNQLSITATTGDVLIYQTPASLVTPKQNPNPA